MSWGRKVDKSLDNNQSWLYTLRTAIIIFWEIKQQRRRRLRGRQLQSEVALLQTLSRLFHLVQFVKYWQFFFFLEQNSKVWRSSGKEKQSRCFVFTTFTTREIRHFHVVAMQWRQSNVQKGVMYVQSCCSANRNLLLFCRRRCLSSLLSPVALLFYSYHDESVQ